MELSGRRSIYVWAGHPEVQRISVKLTYKRPIVRSACARLRADGRRQTGSWNGCDGWIVGRPELGLQCHFRNVGLRLQIMAGHSQPIVLPVGYLPRRSVSTPFGARPRVWSSVVHVSTSIESESGRAPVLSRTNVRRGRLEETVAEPTVESAQLATHSLE